jgi:predicted phosphodiesterase
MTKIRVMSDVHLEFGSLSVPDVEADVAVLAGDIHVGVSAAAWADDLAKQLGIPVVLIPGNHEFYGTWRRSRRGQHLGSIIEGLRVAAAATAGRAVFLERETAIVAGVRFIGCCLWTDFELYGDPAEAMAHAENLMNDFHSIAYRPGGRFRPNDARREFMLSKAFLETEFSKPFSGRTVVVTHHLPSLRSIPERFKSDMLSAAYASQLDALVEASGAALWIHGHTHDSVNYLIGSTRVVCNPRGYYGYQLNPRFDPKLVVTVGEK